MSEEEVVTIAGMIDRWNERAEKQLASLTPEERAARDRAIAAEQERRELVELEDLVARHIPPRYREAGVSRSEVSAWLSDPDALPALLLSGNVGVGKTHEAFGVLKHMLAAGRRFVAYEPAPAMFWKLQPGCLDNVHEYVRTLQEATFLVLDDLGANKLTEAREDALWLILDERYRWQRRTVLATNVPPASMSDALGERTASRLAEMCLVVRMTGVDRRRAS